MRKWYVEGRCQSCGGRTIMGHGKDTPDEAMELASRLYIKAHHECDPGSLGIVKPIGAKRMEEDLVHVEEGC